MKNYELIKGIGFFILGGAAAKTIHIVKDRLASKYAEDEVYDDEL